MNNDTFQASLKLSTKLVAREEGFRDRAYRNAPQEPWTIGFGFTFWPTGTPVKEGEGMSRLFAETFLEKQIGERLRSILAVVGPRVALNPNQAAALVSLHHNIGPGNFLKSTVLRCLKKGQFQQAADAFLLWKRGNTADDLLPRRKRERTLFLKPTNGGGAA